MGSKPFLEHSGGVHPLDELLASGDDIEIDWQIRRLVREHVRVLCCSGQLASSPALPI